MEKQDKGGTQAQSRHIPEVSHPMLLQEPFLYLLSPNQAFETKLLMSKKQVIPINIQEMNDNRISAFLTAKPIWVLQCHKVKKKKEKELTFHIYFRVSQSRNDIEPTFLVLHTRGHTITGLWIRKKCKTLPRCITAPISNWTPHIIFILPSRINFYWGHLPYPRHILPDGEQQWSSLI